MTRFDLICLLFIALALLIDHFVLWRAFLRQTQISPGLARQRYYAGLIAELWTFVAAVVALWLYEGRSWTSLRLGKPEGWRLPASIGLVLAVTIMLAIAIVRTLAKIARLKGHRQIKIPSHGARFAPHTRSELLWWTALSLSAGFSEELIFRGYLIWVLQPLLGVWGAGAISVFVFAAAHAYEGVKGSLAAGMIGGMFTLVVVGLGSLWPAIAMHTLIDVEQGLVSWFLLREVREGNAFIIAVAPKTAATHGESAGAKPDASPN